MQRCISSIPLNLIKEIMKKMDLLSFTRMSQTCKKIHTLMDRLSKEFNIACEMELYINFITNANLKSIAQYVNVPILEDHDIHLRILRPEFRFIQTFNQSSIGSVLEKFAFVKFSKTTLFYDRLDAHRAFEIKFADILNAFKVNKITVDAITMRNSDFIEEAIRVLKPKTVHCSLADEELVLPYEPELWSLLERVSFDNCDAANLMLNVVPLCRKVKIRAAFTKEWTEWDNFVFIVLLRKILMCHCINADFDGYFSVVPDKILESLSTFYHQKIEKIASNHLNAIYVLPMASNVPNCLIILISSLFFGSRGTTRIEYFLASTWNHVISRKIHSFHQPDTEITNIFDDSDLSALMSFFEVEIYKLREKVFSFPCQQISY